MSVIKIQNNNNLPVIDYRIVKPLQGDLKDLSETNYNKLLGVLQTRGFTAPLFLWHNNDEYYLMDGHQRQRVMLKEDMQPYEVPYITIEAKDLQDAKAQLLELTSQYGHITQEGFDEFIADLPEAEIIEAVSFDALPFLGTKVDEPEVEEDEPPEISEEVPVSRLGEVYQLGRHRLMCGDATSEDDVATLLAGATPNLMVTDPPYGVEYDPEWRDGADLGIGNRSRGKVQNDDRADWHEAYDLFPGNVAYIWCASQRSAQVAQSLLDIGYELISQIIWVKQHFALSRGNYHWQHEPCWYVVKSGAKHNWQGARDQTTVWNIANNNAFGGQGEEKFGHGTQKPVECMARPIRNNSARGDVIYDPFVGSGTTLIAAQQLDRTCYAMDIDPKYCDAIRKRYAKFIDKEDEWEQITPIVSSVNSKVG